MSLISFKGGKKSLVVEVRGWELSKFSICRKYVFIQETIPPLEKLAGEFISPESAGGSCVLG